MNATSGVTNHRGLRLQLPWKLRSTLSSPRSWGQFNTRGGWCPLSLFSATMPMEPTAILGTTIKYSNGCNVGIPVGGEFPKITRRLGLIYSPRRCCCHRYEAKFRGSRSSPGTRQGEDLLALAQSPLSEIAVTRPLRKIPISQGRLMGH